MRASARTPRQTLIGDKNYFGREFTAYVVMVKRRANGGREDEAVLLSDLPGEQPVLSLPVTLLTRRLDSKLRQR